MRRGIPLIVLNSAQAKETKLLYYVFMILAVMAFAATQAPILVVKSVEPMPIAKGKPTVAMPILAGRLSAGRSLSTPPLKKRLGP